MEEVYGSLSVRVSIPKVLNGDEGLFVRRGYYEKKIAWTVTRSQAVTLGRAIKDGYPESTISWKPHEEVYPFD